MNNIVCFIGGVEVNGSFIILFRVRNSGYTITGNREAVATKSNTLASFEPCREKMAKEGISQFAISAFESSFNSLVSGDTGIIPESAISPVSDLLRADSIAAEPNPDLLSETVVLKLNGGLGTSMGLDRAKSLLEVKDGETFLDLTAKQVMRMRTEYGRGIKFMLMNSFSTSDGTREFLRRKYPHLAAEEGLELLQSKVPKLDRTTFEVSLIPTIRIR